MSALLPPPPGSQSAGAFGHHEPGPDDNLISALRKQKALAEEYKQEAIQAREDNLKHLEGVSKDFDRF